MSRALLRRVGGLRRLLVVVGAALALVFLLQTFAFFDSGARWRGERVTRPGVLAPVTERRPVQPDKAAAAPTAAAAKGSGEKRVCGADSKCATGQLTFSLSSSIVDSDPPKACLNDLLIFDSAKLAKGLNVVILDEKTKTVEDIKYFDVLASDREFIGFMTHVDGARVILVASWGDVAEKVSAESREMLQKFGSARVADFKRGSSFVMVGQKGLKIGSAFEAVGVVTGKSTDALASQSGCISFPMGPLDESVSLHQGREQAPDVLHPGQLIRRESIVYGDVLPHCGRRTGCARGQVAVSMYSGKNKDDQPRMCIDGRFLVSRNLNKAGRGLNIVVINATSKDVLRVGHFDTYAEDSSTLEIFLEQMIAGEMLLLVTFDEAATRLSGMAKQMFYELGSGLAQNLKFRASWYFIGQKGISGFSPFEELNYASGNEWAKPIDTKLCVPVKLDGQMARPDPMVQKKNEAKRAFCDKFDGYEEFCDEAHLDDPITPAPLANKSRSADPIFKVPLLIIAGLSHNSLRLCLETVLLQPGVDASRVLVTYDENYQESAALSALFQFQSVAINASASYMGQYVKSLDTVWKRFPDAEAVIVIEEELLLTNDFLFYMSQLLPVIKSDESLLAVSAWNDNGFEQVSTMERAVYRVESFPGLGYLLPRRTFDALLAGKLETCCRARAWDGWLDAAALGGRHSLVPDVSRVVRRHADGLGVLESHVEHLFHRQRNYTKSATVLIARPERLAAAAYERAVDADVKAAAAFPRDVAQSCLDGRPLELKPALLKATHPAQFFVLTYQQESVADHTQLSKLCRCFGLYHSDGRPARGLYKGVLRFSLGGHAVYLVGSKSPFYGPPRITSAIPKLS